MSSFVGRERKSNQGPSELVARYLAVGEIAFFRQRDNQLFDNGLEHGRWFLRCRTEICTAYTDDGELLEDVYDDRRSDDGDVEITTACYLLRSVSKNGQDYLSCLEQSWAKRSRYVDASEIQP